MSRAITRTIERLSSLLRRASPGDLDLEVAGEVPAATIAIEEIGHAAHIFLHPERHGELHDHMLALPDWFVTGLDPEAPAYRDQQLRLWQAITGRPRYDRATCEDSPEVMAMDHVRRPSFYITGRAAEAAPHIIAMGHILLHSGIREGDRVLEYGAGFGRNALAFARLGAVVDTVDISAGYCAAVAAAARQYDVSLRPHQQPFGFNPAGEDESYDLILFYESFHHALDFRDLIPRLHAMLKPGGRLILAGEPIVRGEERLMPYPWGIRLDWQNVAVMRLRGWMELGFREDHLMPLFAAQGFSWTFHEDPRTDKANLYLLSKAQGTAE